MKRYARLLIDFMFKKCFGTEANKPLLIGLLNDCLGAKLLAPIVTLNYQPTSTQGKTTTSRGTVFDLSCEDRAGNRFLIEVQLEAQKYFSDRALFYRSRAQSEMLPKGEPEDRSTRYRLPRFHILAFLDFKLDDAPEYERDILLMDARTHTVFSDREIFTYIEMPKFTKEFEHCQSPKERWLWLLSNMHHLENQPAALKGTLFETLFEIAEIGKFVGEELEQYRKSMEFYDDTDLCIAYAKELAEQQGLASGMEKGLAQGLQRGLEQGLEQEHYQ